MGRQGLVRKKEVTGSERTTGGVGEVEREEQHMGMERVIAVEEIIVLDEGTIGVGELEV